jgi:hypothetical protein
MRVHPDLAVAFDFLAIRDRIDTHLCRLSCPLGYSGALTNTAAVFVKIL